MENNTEIVNIPAIKVDNVAKEEHESGISLANSMAIDIKTNADYDTAASFLKAIKTRIATLDDFRKSLTRPLDEAKKKIMAFFDRPIANYQRAEATIKNAILFYQQKIEAEQRAAEAKLKAEQEAEIKRLEAEAKKEKDTVRQQELLDKADIVKSTPLTLATTIPKVTGIKKIENWTAEVTDLKVLLKYCLETGNMYVIADMKMLNATAKSAKDRAKIPGVVFKNTPGIAAGKE